MQKFEFYDNESAYDSSKSRNIDVARLRRFSATHRQSKLVKRAIKQAMGAM